MSKNEWNNGSPVDFQGAVYDAAGDMIKAGKSAVIGSVEAVAEIMGLSDDLADFKRNANNILSKDITDFLSLVPENTTDNNAAKTPQQKKSVDSRRGPGEGE